MTISPDGQFEWNGSQWVPRTPGSVPPPPPMASPMGYGGVANPPKSKIVAGILGILILVGSGITKDAQGRPLSDT